MNCQNPKIPWQGSHPTSVLRAQHHNVTSCHNVTAWPWRHHVAVWQHVMSRHVATWPRDITILQHNHVIKKALSVGCLFLFIVWSLKYPQKTFIKWPKVTPSICLLVCLFISLLLSPLSVLAFVAKVTTASHFFGVVVLVFWVHSATPSFTHTHWPPSLSDSTGDYPNCSWPEDRPEGGKNLKEFWGGGASDRPLLSMWSPSPSEELQWVAAFFWFIRSVVLCACSCWWVLNITI